jgi:hypothetical protein
MHENQKKSFQQWQCINRWCMEHLLYRQRHDVLMRWCYKKESPPSTIPFSESEQLLESKAFALQWS